jgi:hypothetical protein
VDTRYRDVFLTALDRAGQAAGYDAFRDAMVVPIQTILNQSLCGDSALLSAVETVMIPGTQDVGSVVWRARTALASLAA